jgi:hypothetical protein
VRGVIESLCLQQDSSQFTGQVVLLGWLQAVLIHKLLVALGSCFE